MSAFLAQIWITPHGVKFGMMVAEIFGNADDDEAAIRYLRENNVKVEVLGYVL